MRPPLFRVSVGGGATNHERLGTYMSCADFAVIEQVKRPRAGYEVVGLIPLKALLAS